MRLTPFAAAPPYGLLGGPWGFLALSAPFRLEHRARFISQICDFVLACLKIRLRQVFSKRSFSVFLRTEGGCHEALGHRDDFFDAWHRRRIGGGRDRGAPRPDA